MDAGLTLGDVWDISCYDIGQLTIGQISEMTSEEFQEFAKKTFDSFKELPDNIEIREEDQRVLSNVAEKSQYSKPIQWTISAMKLLMISIINQLGKDVYENIKPYAIDLFYLAAKYIEELL